MLFENRRDRLGRERESQDNDLVASRGGRRRGAVLNIGRPGRDHLAGLIDTELDLPRLYRAETEVPLRLHAGSSGLGEFVEDALEAQVGRDLLQRLILRSELEQVRIVDARWVNPESVEEGGERVADAPFRLHQVLHHLPRRGLTNFLDGGQEQTDEDRDDGDDDEQLDERKAGRMSGAPASSSIEGLLSSVWAVWRHRGQRGKLCVGHRTSSEYKCARCASRSWAASDSLPFCTSAWPRRGPAHRPSCTGQAPRSCDTRPCKP